MDDTMFGGFLAINVKPEHRRPFLEASIFQAQNAVSEENDVFQFHILVDEENPNRFYFYEVFRNEASIQEYWETENFKSWLITVRQMLDGEIEFIARMHSIFPTAKGFEAQKHGLLHW